MAIFQLFEEETTERFNETFDASDMQLKGKSRLFSTILTRFCFLLLLFADLAWLVYNSLLLSIAIVGVVLTGGKVPFFRRFLRRFGLHFRRSLVCGLSLFVGLFCPPFGIMVACTYFLMYDKTGMEEVVPASLQSQFKDIFQPSL